MIRCFEDENILRDEGAINPVSDKEIIDTELQLKDLESVDKKISRTEKMARTDPENESGARGADALQTTPRKRQKHS